ncbi:cytochrome P450 [Gordonia sp. TBRC 11910]|uniref:Cytochrome P450 n=1 Tax=Gordonia asplenii TaxID=2725283 RepID=A0A848L3F1_9ACTN|nr:cytochrome P450 [Gordonia asplenii]NMO03585.1 cytochrome P450 [Gordonia asplenii]
MTTTNPSSTVDLSTVDLTDLSYFDDGPPHELFARMRREASPHWNALTDSDEPGFWSFTKFADIQAISANPAVFSSARGGVFTTTRGAAPVEVLREVILGMDPPRHTQQRNIVQAVFTPRMIRQKQADIRATVNTLINEVIERGECDFVTDIAVELPLRVIADMLGVPREERGQLFEWTNRLSLAAATSDPDMGLGALMEIAGYLTELTAARKANPQDDLISRLVQAEVDGESLTEMEVTFFFGILMFAGNDTTRNTSSGAMRALIENPDQRKILVADTSLVGNAVEEFLRWVTPVQYFTRVAQEDTVVGGHAIAEGERVAMWYSAGSRDPEVIDDPETFDITRDKPPHQAFGGGGPHFCLGNQLARLQLRILFEELMRRMPDMEFAGPVTRLTSNFSNELTSMPVTFTPGAVESVEEA